jgi:hypothetical protein
MGTFTEFYIALLRFVNYKLFTDCGMAYPFAEHPEYLECPKIKELQAKVRKLFDQGENEIDESFRQAPEMQRLFQRQEESQKGRKLFSNSVFLLGRETPIYILQYLILSFGGSYLLQDDLPDDEKEQAKVMKTVTHVC